MTRSWLISGISSGFGRAMAETLLARGDRVAGTVRDPAAVADLATLYGDRLWVATLDLAQTDTIAGVVDRAWSALGRIDVLVSNAGYGLMGAAEEVTDAMIRHQIDTNLLGSIQLIRSALPHLRAQGGGRIMQLSSMGGQAAFAGGALYHATKWGIEGFVEAVAQEVGVFGIGCTIVQPGGARTDFGPRSATIAPELAAYDASPSRMVNHVMADALSHSPGDPARMVAAMIASVEQEPAPLRLALGSDAYQVMRARYAERLLSLEAQRDVALSTDAAEDEPRGEAWFDGPTTIRLHAA